MHKLYTGTITVYASASKTTNKSASLFCSVEVLIKDVNFSVSVSGKRGQNGGTNTKTGTFDFSTIENWQEITEVYEVYDSYSAKWKSISKFPNWPLVKYNISASCSNDGHGSGAGFVHCDTTTLEYTKVKFGG